MVLKSLILCTAALIWIKATLRRFGQNTVRFRGDVMHDIVQTGSPAMPGIRRIAVDRPWHWLRLGWNDFLRMPALSLTYGVIFVTTSFALTLGFWLLDAFYVVLPAAAGFAFIAPLLAVGLYQASRDLNAGRRPNFLATLSAYRRNAGQLALIGFVLMCFHLIWVRVATLLYALFFNTATPSWQYLVESIFFSPQSLPFLVIGTMIGAAFAVVVFAISAVSIPMLLDRDISAMTAIFSSMAAVRINWRPMALWAVLIGGFIAGGIATLYVGLAVCLPLIGHASWHAYRDLIE
jgi:uncharacterized membrane protein